MKQPKLQELEQVQREVTDLKTYSFLIAKADPYVVLPGFMLRQTNHPFLAKMRLILTFLWAAVSILLILVALYIVFKGNIR